MPFWLVIVLSILATIAIVDRIFAPGVRWYFRRRVNDAIDELNDRLDLGIQPFKLTTRQSLVDQLLVDPDIISAVDERASGFRQPARGNHERSPALR